MIDEDETPSSAGAGEVSDNSLGRLLTLSDGIFAIAMTLLALDLKVPDLGAHPTDNHIRHELAANLDSYLSFLLTFFVIAGYWIRHRQLMRSVVTIHPILVRDTMFLLLIVAAMPFPASLLGTYGGEPSSVALYGAMNALGWLSVIVLSWDVKRLKLATAPLGDSDYAHSLRSWLNLAAFLLCIPAAYLLGRHGAYALLLLVVPDRVAWLRGAAGRIRRRRHHTG